jgi:uncharacterized protein (DUF362 family)
MDPTYQRPSGVSRRSFLAGAAVGLAAGVPATWAYLRRAERPIPLADQPSSFTGKTVEDPSPQYAMPGPFPGRVIEVNHPGSVEDGVAINPPAVKAMMDRGMCELTGADHPVEAWKKFFGPDDVVGIKVNPVGQKSRPNVIGAISSPAVLLEVVAGLKSAGVKPSNLIVFERYAREFRSAGYEAVMRERDMDGVRWLASSLDGGELQVDIEGHDGTRERDKNVVGYDQDVFVHMGFCSPAHDPKDDRRFRSHVSRIITQMVNKFITIPVLKDHRSAGVTLALKNLSHGMNNNVARSHLSGIHRRGGETSGPNQCNTFIPTAVGQAPIRQKATLHILDGLIGVYEGGPGTWNTTWATWPYKSLFFATDPVAMDHVGWDIIDTKRAQEGWPAVARMGLMQQTPALMLSTRLAALAARSPLETTTDTFSAQHFEGGRGSEAFDRRQPEHIILAGTIGLGVFDARGIQHRRIRLEA